MLKLLDSVDSVSAKFTSFHRHFFFCLFLLSRRNVLSDLIERRLQSLVKSSIRRKKRTHTRGRGCGKDNKRFIIRVINQFTRSRQLFANELKRKQTRLPKENPCFNQQFSHCVNFVWTKLHNLWAVRKPNLTKSLFFFMSLWIGKRFENPKRRITIQLSLGNPSSSRAPRYPWFLWIFSLSFN